MIADLLDRAAEAIHLAELVDLAKLIGFVLFALAVIVAVVVGMRPERGPARGRRTRPGR